MIELISTVAFFLSLLQLSVSYEALNLGSVRLDSDSNELLIVPTHTSM